MPSITGVLSAVMRQLSASPFIRDLLLDELRAARVRARNRLGFRRGEISRIRRTPEQLVNIACGPHVATGFLNLDTNDTVPGVVPWDCRASLPLDDDMAAGVRVEHFVEHLEPRQELPRFLSELHRVLRVHGVARIIVPDAARYLEAYCRGDLLGFRELGVPDPFPEDLPTRMDVVNHVFHQWHEHRWAYDFETLADRLRRSGFRTVERTAFRQSRDPRLACDRDVHAAYSLYVDAVK